MYKPFLFANYRVLVPLISHLSPGLAYRVLGLTGGLGKPLSDHTSFLYEHPAVPIGVDSLMKHLQCDRQKAEEIIRRYYIIETRWELENRWLSQRRDDYLNRIIRMDDVRAPILPPDPLDLQAWADRLKSVVRKAPASWFGWFLLNDMLSSP